MPTLTPEDNEHDQRRALADAHRTVATIYDNRDLPFLSWAVSRYAKARAYTNDLNDLDAYAGWLDQPHREDHTGEDFDHHWVTGSKEGVALQVTYIVELQP